MNNDTYKLLAAFSLFGVFVLVALALLNSLPKHQSVKLATAANIPGKTAVAATPYVSSIAVAAPPTQTQQISSVKLDFNGVKAVRIEPIEGVFPANEHYASFLIFDQSTSTSQVFIISKATAAKLDTASKSMLDTLQPSANQAYSPNFLLYGNVKSLGVAAGTSYYELNDKVSVYLKLYYHSYAMNSFNDGFDYYTFRLTTAKDQPTPIIIKIRSTWSVKFPQLKALKELEKTSESQSIAVQAIAKLGKVYPPNAKYYDFEGLNVR